MAGQSRKSTKKFEKKHLKDTLEKRKELAKTKQRHQAKAKRKARNAKDYARASDDEAETGKPKAQPKSADKFNAMSVDQFFQGGFQLPELRKTTSTTKTNPHEPVTGKRKRGSDNASTEDSDSSSEGHAQAFSDDEVGSGEADGLENHQEDLDALAAKDPEFYKYLQENDAELLDFGGGDLAEVDQLSDDEKPKKKYKKSRASVAEDPDEAVQEEAVEEASGEVEVTVTMVSKWKNAMTEQHSLRAMRQVLLAFRTAAYVNADNGKSHKYLSSSPDAYHQLLILALEHVPSVLHHHVPFKESATGKIRIAMDSKKFRTLTPLLQSHSAAVIHLLENLSDAPTIKKTLNSFLPLLPYLLSFKRILKSLVRGIVDIWSDTSTADPTRITAFLVIRRLAVISDASIRIALLKTAYQGW